MRENGFGAKFTPMELDELAGRSFGPRAFYVSAQGVADFVEVTGDDRKRWLDAAPPGYASAALFVVAPELLHSLGGRFVIHGEQVFSWHQPIQVGAALEAAGSVTRVRERAGTHFVGFDLMVTGDDGPVLEGSSLFLISAHGADGDQPAREEPPANSRGSVPDGWVSASRADLIRYAATTRDWNPIHWDHASARAAGLPGVVVHGLLQASWAFAAVARKTQGTKPLSVARVRFRNPLFPSCPAEVKVEQKEGQTEVVLTDGENEYLSARVEMDDG